MATSRTGTGQYKRWRKAILTAGQQAGITNCPSCNQPLDYTKGRQPNSAEPDHIWPHSLGGTNTIENGRILCRTCNIKRGNGNHERKAGKRTAATKRSITALVDW